MSVIQEEIKSLLGDHVLKTDVVKLLNLNKPGKPQDVHHTISLPLEKLYVGMSVRIRADKKIPCSDCNKGYNKRNCDKCLGVGNIASLPCNVCQGRKILDIRCIVCGGKANIQKEKYFTVKVPAGSRNGEQIRLTGEGDTMLNQPYAASDIVCTIKEVPHKEFQRCGADLYLIKTINITQALCGCKLVVTHLDGRKIVARSRPGTVIKPGDMRCVKNEGMPSPFSKTGAKGDLIIVFNVLFPASLEKTVVENLESYLPRRTDFCEPSGDVDEYFLGEFDPKEQVYHVPHKTYEDSPAKTAQPKTQDNKIPECAQQ